VRHGVRCTLSQSVGHGRRRLCPPSKDSHECTPRHHAPERIHELPVRCRDHLLVEKEFVREELNEAGVDQDPRAERVQHAAYDARRGTAGVVR
jgi:hypothetical protein